MTVSGSSYFADTDADLVADRQSKPRRALFLDRDGVINVDHAYVHTAEMTDWLPGIFDFCRTAADSGLLLVVVTNQAGIARGLYGKEEFTLYTQWMHEQFRQRGVPLLATYYCPHHPDAGIGTRRVHCDCRKPAPGMILDAAERYGITLSESWLIGNRESDIEAGIAAKVGKLILLQDECGAMGTTDSALKVRSLEEARKILIESNQ